MTYQYLTVEMFEHAKTIGGYIDQKLFKTTGTYGFDSIVLDKISIEAKLAPVLNLCGLFCNQAVVYSSQQKWESIWKTD